MRFNYYMNNHFAGCRLLARARDDHRNRQVQIYQIPGHWDVVGITDGTDSWIAPTSTGPFFKTATGDVTAIMRRLEAGEDPLPVPDAPPRRRVLLLESQPGTTSRPRTPVTTTTTERSNRRVILA